MEMFSLNAAFLHTITARIQQQHVSSPQLLHSLRTNSDNHSDLKRLASTL